MTLQDGTARQRALFALLVAVPLLGLCLAIGDRLERIGQPNVGWMNDETSISPTRPDTSEAGLRGGGQALRVNGVAISPDLQATHVAGVLHTEIGATNTLTIRTPRG